MTRTPKRRALGSSLRQAREAQGLTGRELAARLKLDQSILSRWETGDRTPKPEQVVQLLTALGINGEQYDEIIALSYGPDDPSWVATTLPAQRQQLEALLDFEQNADRIIEVSPLLVPGLLQTGDYIKAMMLEDKPVPPGEIAHRVAVRIGRREVITRKEPAKLLALVGEAALHQAIGGDAIVLDQLRYLLEMARRPNIDLRVFRLKTNWHPALEGPFLLIESGSSAVVHLENRKSGLFLHEDGDVNAYRKASDKVLETAMNADDSAKLIAEIIRRTESDA